MSICRLLLGLWLVLLLVGQTRGGWWRRSSCSRHNCVWGGWSAWGPCSDPCGRAGTRSRTRGVSSSASCGGSSCSGPSSQTSACNRFCYNSGTPQPGYCNCPDEFWDTCCDKPCTEIANCLHIVCSSGTNQQCRRCQHDHGGEKKAYRLANRDTYTNRICEQLCSWRSDSSFCYPGNCTDGPSSCQCAPGFGSHNCLTIDVKPSMSYCLITTRSSNGPSTDKVEIKCEDEKTVVYTNFLPDVMEIVFNSVFMGPSVIDFPKKYYIIDFKVGITNATFKQYIVRDTVDDTMLNETLLNSTMFNETMMNDAMLNETLLNITTANETMVNGTMSNGTNTIPSSINDCAADISQDNPHAGMLACNFEDSIPNAPLRHGDRVYFVVSTSNGGYVKINNMDNSQVDPPRYYSGRTAVHTAQLVIDQVKPFHCSIQSNCTDNMLDRGLPTTQSANLTLRWAGWTDALAGIKQYELTVYKMKLYGDKLAHHGVPELLRVNLPGTENATNVTLVEPGVYAVLLAAEDNAGNTQTARRFLIFDNTSVINISSADDSQLVVNSAALNTSCTWLTSLQDTTNVGEQVSTIWHGHFVNELQHSRKFLDGIAPNYPPINRGYEEMTGQPPDTISMEAIPNVNAIVKYELSYAVDHDGGRSLIDPGSWVNVTEFQKEEMRVDIPRADGDSVHVWVRATDVMGNTYIDSVLVHVDSSPPVIQDIWLSRHGRTQLAVHHSTELFDMIFQIDSYDFHSGLKEIRWQLHDLLDSDVLHGSGQVAVHRHTGAMSDCVAPICYCIPKDNECFLRHFEINPDMSKMVKPHGDHDFDYQLVLNVTNNAMLSSIFTFKITVDTTAPLPGVVSDSEQSEPDVDFQQSSTQHASWQGFFDRESSILFYQYAFSDICLTASDFSFPPTGQVNETTLTYASRTVSGPGTYHCTVVAYNKALEPSESVCSDGVTVDTTAPEIHEVSVENSWTKDGLVKDSTGHVWYIDRNRFRVLVDQPSESCRQKSRLESNVSMYRVKKLQKSSGKNNITFCLKQTFEDRPNIVISKENMLELSWFGSDDESGIHMYEVGLGSTGSEDMDLLSYMSTHGHRHFITYHPDLMDGETFYIHIKAVNRAGQQMVEVIGPITVQVDAPTFSGDIAVAVQEHNGITYMVGRWNISGFSAEDLQDGSIYGYSYAVGHSPNMDDVKNFALLTQESSVSGLCTWTDLPTCVATPVDDLQWGLHGRHTYYITLKIEGVNGLERVASSKEYEHYVGPPSAGVIVEIPVDSNELMSEDIDHQSSESRLHIAWFGFHHVDRTISYELAVGTAPGKDDVIGFVGVDSSSKLLTNLALQPFKTYFTSVRASTKDGSTLVSSDGVIVLPVDMKLEGAEVLDVLPCSSDGSQSAVTLSHHDTAFPNQSCEVDIDFQSSVTHMGIQWSLPANLTTFVTTVKWGLQEYASKSWLEFCEMMDTSGIGHVTATDLHLEPGRTYRAVVTFCHPDGCFLPVYSNGVTITPDAPKSTGIISTSLTDTNLTFTWSQFTDPSINSRTATTISRHEWTLLVDQPQVQSPEHLYPWRLMADIDINCNQTTSSANDLCSFTIPLAAPLETSSCVVLALRAYNKIGLYSTVMHQLRGCDVTSKMKLIVIDAVATMLDGDIALENNDPWPMADREYTPSSLTLSAVWPDLHHGTYHWKVVSDDSIMRFAYVQPETAPDYTDYDCLSPEVLACGVTQDSFVNVHDLSLNEGQRYHICILANATDILVENVTEHLERNSKCSNGIVVDKTPPIAGKVWVGGHEKHWRYQIDRSHLSIYWSSFVDIETYGRSSHHSVILKYEYAIGTFPEGVDVRDYIEVGVTNMAVATRLVLKDGITYYVTVRATDHVGRSTLSQSPGVTIDSTPPDVSAVPIDVGGAYMTDARQLYAAWTGIFSDDESGIDHYYWCVGSKSGYCDLKAYVITTEQQISTGPQDDLRLKDGHMIYVSVQAVNRVGLITVSTSRAVVVDGSQPIAGHVYDVVSDSHTKDVDYTTVASEIGAKWSGFHDPHSHITGYSVSIGKCRQCDDILEKSHVGISSSIHMSHVTLERGVTYYTTVEACNGAGLCVTLTSDGVIADTSPPVAGDLFDGISTEDIDYQSSRSTISAHWLNVHDPESGLLHMEWRAGTTRGHGDILAPTRLHLTDKTTATFKQPLPVGKRIYITLKVFNKAGLSTEITSDGFIIDNTAPVTTRRIGLCSRLGSLKKDTQVWTSSLSVQWQMSDKESSIVEQFVSVTTRDSVHHDVPSVKLYGDEQEYTFSNVSLTDGEIYYAKVIACNGARLCTTSVSEGILVDSTPPVAGAFAIETDHAAALTRHHIGWMTYENNTLHLSWLGFSDAHADVKTYSVIVGTKFGYLDMLPTDTPVMITHTTDVWHEDEGFVQKANISVTSAIQQNQQLYVSLWAENKVGLVSSRLHGTFMAIPSQSATGTLALVRRCQPVTCEGHCTCAPHGQLTCTSTVGCLDVKGKPGYWQLSVYDIEDYTVTPESNTQDVDFTRSQSTLGATWRPATTHGKAPVRYEWTVGVDGHPVGAGLLDVHKESIWRETGHAHLAVYTTRSSRKSGVVLKSHAKYVMYIRAWYDAVSYAVYVTDGAMTDSSPPELSRAAKVTELQSATSKGDVDFITSLSSVTLSWRSVFRDSQAAIQRYVTSISKILGGRDIAEKHLTSSVTKMTFDKLTLDANDVYYCTVVSYNEAGLFRSAYSDGFKVDVTPPVTGQVWDGRGLTDQDYSRDNRTVAAWWRGFSDDQSYIDHYEWCVGTGPGKENVMACRDVGLHTHRSARLSAAQVSGTRLYSTVYAVNGAGLKSVAVSSDGTVIDLTPPRPLHKFQLGANLLKNPSFEEDMSQPGTQEAVPRKWTGDGTFYLTSATDSGGQDGQSYVDIVCGYIEQTVATIVMTKYRVMFYVHSPNNDRFHSQQLGFVRLPHVHTAFVVAPTTSSSGEWQKHVYYFTATDTKSVIRVGAVGHKTGFLLDNVQVQEVGSGQRSSAADRNNSPMHMHVSSRGSYTAVTAAWDVEDPESPVTSYSWAIGTVRGGVQLQNFRSVGVQTHAHADALLLQQGTEVHATVVAKNAAGLTTVIYSDPHTIDLTPPVLCCLIDGVSKIDTTDQTSHTLTITWSVTDPESRVSYCEWAAGKRPGSQEVQSFTRTTSLSTASVTLDASVSHGETIFCVVRCFNYAGFQSTLVSSGVVMVTAPPDVSMATLNIITSSVSHYPARDNHQADSAGLFFGWEGVRDRAGIASYQVSLQRTGATTVLPWQAVASASQLYARLQDLGLQSYSTYTLLVRATNSADLTSDVIATNFTIETEAPQVTNLSPQSLWPQRSTLTLDWTDVFTSNSSLVYEVNIGTTRGGIDVLSWLDTERTVLHVTGVDHTKEHYVTLTAINKAGLYTMRTFVAAYTLMTSSK